MNYFTRAAVLLAVAGFTAANAQSGTGQSGTGQSGFSAARLARIDTALKRYVDEGKVAGLVALVLRDGKPVYQTALGWSDKEAGRRMTMDAMFRIASRRRARRSPALRS